MSWLTSNKDFILLSRIFYFTLQDFLFYLAGFFILLSRIFYFTLQDFLFYLAGFFIFIYKKLFFLFFKNRKALFYLKKISGSNSLPVFRWIQLSRPFLLDEGGFQKYMAAVISSTAEFSETEKALICQRMWTLWAMQTRGVCVKQGRSEARSYQF